MLAFLPVNTESAKRLAPLFAEQPYRSCDYTVGATYQWRAYFDSSYCVVADMAILHACYPGEGCCFMLPVGPGDMQAALDAIEADAAARCIPLKFCAVPEKGLDILRARYGERMRFSPHRDWADYLYEIGSLQTFAGKKLHGQKNHLNRFLREHPTFRYVPVTEETLPTAEAFLAGYAAHTDVDKPIEAEEMLRSQELLRDALTLGLTAAYIEVDGTVVALSVGENIGDTLYVHVEKARLDYAGAYQAIVSQFAQHAAGPDTRFCNREDDSGEEGLRTSKLAYQPLTLIDKYWVTID